MKTRRIKKLFSLLLVIVLTASCLPLSASAVDYGDGSTIGGTGTIGGKTGYSSSWKYWSQGGSAYEHMRKVGCYVTAASKLMVESGLKSSSSFTPDDFYKWCCRNGHLDSRYNMVNLEKAIEGYTGGRVTVTDTKVSGSYDTVNSKIIADLNSGKYVIVYSSTKHFIYIYKGGSSSSKAFILDSMSDKYNEKYCKHRYANASSRCTCYKNLLPLSLKESRYANTITRIISVKVDSNPGPGVTPSPEVTPTPPPSTASFNTTVKDVTQTSATLDTNITANAVPSESGVYFGTSSGNLKKLSSDGASKSTTPHVWYSTSKYYGKLTAGTTYYYQFYTVVKGKTIWDSKRSFTTLQGENKAKASFDSSAKDITKTSATMHAYVTASAVPSSGGMYFGTSTSNLKLLGSDTGLKSKTPHLWYATSKYYGALKPGVTYYYRPYVVISGATVWGDIKTFQTAKCTNHVKGAFRFYEAVHPHKNYYTCSVCGESFTDRSTSKMDSCTTCNPPKIELKLFYDDGVFGYLNVETKSGTTTSQTFTIINSKPTRENYTFLGWSTSSDASIAEYHEGDKITISKDTILYSVWKRDSSFRLSYYYYSDSTKNGYEEKESNDTFCLFIVRSAEEAKKGYSFKGWSWNKNSTIPEYQPGDIVEIEENRTLYAVWESDGTISFEDVTVGAYYYDAVNWAVDNKITSGTSATTFSPDQSCTRAQAVTFLWNSAGKPEPQSSADQFSDVKAGSYYEKAVQWAVEEGITSGTGEGKFSPDAKCTRAQIVTFLYRAEGKPQVLADGSFSDVKTGDYYEIPVQWAAQNGITSGTGGGKFSPEQSCTRGQIVTFLYRNII